MASSTPEKGKSGGPNGRSNNVPGCSRTINTQPLVALEPPALFKGISYKQKFTYQNWSSRNAYWYGIVCDLRENVSAHTNRLKTMVIQEDYWLNDTSLAQVIGFWKAITKVVIIGGPHINHLSLNFHHNRAKDEIRIGALGARCDLILSIVEHCTALQSLRITGSGFQDLENDEIINMVEKIEKLSALRLSWLEIGVKLSESGLSCLFGDKIIDGTQLATLNIQWGHLLVMMPNTLSLPNVRNLTLTGFGRGDKSSHNNVTLKNFTRIFQGVHELNLYKFVPGTHLNLPFVINELKGKMYLFRSLGLDESLDSITNTWDAENEDRGNSLDKLTLKMGYCSCGPVDGQLERCLRLFHAPMKLDLLFEPGSNIDDELKIAIRQAVRDAYDGNGKVVDIHFNINTNYDSDGEEIADQMALLGLNL